MTLPNRSERRRQERAAANRRGQRQPVVIAGDGIVAAELPGHTYEAIPHADLAPKVAGQHRWIATAAWVLNDDQVEGITDVDKLKFMDHENLMALSVGCWDCEKPLGEIARGSWCPAPAGP